MFVVKPHKNNSIICFFLNVRGVLICFCCFCLYFISLVLCAFEHSYAHKCRFFFLLNCNLVLCCILHGVVCI